MKPFGLRVDVCHLTALSEGVPPILDLFERLGVRATFFVALGPDNAGRGGLRRMFQPGFLLKMWRTRAWKMYGWKTITSGWFGKSNVISEKGETVLKKLGSSPHEIGLHGWDHAAWQDEIEGWKPSDFLAHESLAAMSYEAVFGRKPSSTAAPGWRMPPKLFQAHDACDFAYASDSRGVSPFFPVVDGSRFRTMQIPVTLPTLDEWMSMGFEASTFFPEIHKKLAAEPFPVLAVHAEAEGRLYLDDFSEFLNRARAAGFEPAPLADIARGLKNIGGFDVNLGIVPGRAQRVLVQGSSV